MSLIVVHSPKGGAGSTTIAAHLAMGLARRGRTVAALDLTRRNAIALHFGVKPEYERPFPGSTGLMTGPPAAARPSETVEGVLLVAPGTAPAAEQEATWLLALPADSETVVVADVGAADEETLEALLPKALLRLCVLGAEPASAALLPSLFGVEGKLKVPQTRFVVNFLDERLRVASDIACFLQSACGPALIGTVRRDEAVNEALAMAQLLPRFAPFSAALADIEAITEKLRPLLVPPAPSTTTTSTIRAPKTPTGAAE